MEKRYNLEEEEMEITENELLELNNRKEVTDKEEDEEEEISKMQELKEQKRKNCRQSKN